ncbi:MAG TPA: 4-(cytidine 5'-diphospho)-2-C-methyl-D-erythritol kinase [Candidatus Lumbricidophila sp.]|nr:4-(cytidine 5'-diphospho)-2-C-methyl-D-erythritol kinase [Candidatus Lumbricidophila sp.]
MLSALPRNSVRVQAPGKINLLLRVGAPGADGFHPLATVFQAVSLYEDLIAIPAPDFAVRFGGSVDVSGLSTDDSNLAVRAARALAAHSRVPNGVHMQIEKHVPIAGGMGGGSADAAAALVACNELWGTELDRHHLHELAASLGSDVPFSLTGGTAIGLGRGDDVSQVLTTGRLHWVLVTAEHGLSTPAVYRELDRMREAGEAPPAPDVVSVDVALLHALRSGDAAALAPTLHNDLQAAAISLAPALGEVLEQGMDAGALAGIVSGSGPTLAFLVPGTDAAHEVRVSLAVAGHQTHKVHGPVHGARVVDNEHS